MSLRRIKPVVQRTNLGSVRMWQEELAEIARLVGTLPDVKVRIEADDYVLTDVVADLPGLGQRVSSFTVTGVRPGAAGSGAVEVVSVKLTKHGSHVEAADPDLPTLGLIGSIEAIAQSRRRLPAKLEPFFDLSPKDSSSGAPVGVLAVVVTLLAVIFGAAFGVGAGQHLMHPHHTAFTPWPLSIWGAVAALLVVAVTSFGWYRARTTLFTVPHQAAPTFWQRNWDTIVITALGTAAGIVVGWLIGQA